MPRGSYRIVYGAESFRDTAGNTNDEITYLFTSTGGTTLRMYDSDGNILKNKDSLLSTGAKNITVKFTRAIKLPAGKKQQIFIEKRQGSSYNSASTPATFPFSRAGKAINQKKSRPLNIDVIESQDLYCQPVSVLATGQNRLRFDEEVCV